MEKMLFRLRGDFSLQYRKWLLEKIEARLSVVLCTDLIIHPWLRLKEVPKLGVKDVCILYVYSN